MIVFYGIFDNQVYYREAVGAIVMFDVSRGATFEAVESWKGDIDKKVSLTEFCEIGL